MRHRDFIQNITITFLALSALFLFSRTQFFQLGTATAGGTWLRLTAPVGTAAGDTPLSDTLSAPVRLAVTGEYGRYGSVSLTTDSESFTPVKTLLREVLGSAREQTESSQEAFLRALSAASVYCDFLTPLPINYISDLMGSGMAESTLSVRALVAAEQNGQVILYLWDGEQRYVQCMTAVQVSTLAEAQFGYELGSAAFAFEMADGGHLAPLSLFPSPLPELPELTAGDASISTEALLTVLGFNPHTNSRYQDADGAEVVVEGDRVIRIGSSGAFVYTSGGESALTVDSAGTIPTPREAVSGVQALLEQLLPAGEARLYLSGWEREEERTTLTFGYQLGGVPILFADGSAAAEVTLTGTAVSALSLRPRQYVSGSAASLLPLRQAMAIAGQKDGVELSIGYADAGTYPLAAVWLADESISPKRS